MLRSVVRIFFLAFTFVLPGVVLGGELFVSPDGGGDGSSWSGPLGSVQEALNISSIGDCIHVKEGTYLERVVMVEGVDLFGGYSSALGGTDISKRDPATYVTTIAAIGYSTPGSVVIGANSATIDGFTLFGGQTSSNGGGMFNASSSPTVANCVFFGNTAVGGGGMYNFQCSPTIINCSFWGNKASLWGGGLYNASSNPTVTNCTFFRNETTGYGRSMFNSSSSPVVTNCIFWSDSAPFQAEIFNYSDSSPTITYCNVEGGYPGAGNAAAEPLFVDPGHGDFHLQSGSPCIDAGDSDAIPMDMTTDFEGDDRIFDDGTVDMGADEYTPTVLRANFSGYPTAGPPSLAVAFTDHSTGFPTAWSWDFDDDGAEDSTVQHPSYTYTSEGRFSVSLTVTGVGQHTVTKTDYVIVAPAPVAAFTVDTTSGIAPLTVQFTDQSTGSITSWSWDFGDSETSSKQNPSHEYQYAGDYTVSLTVTGPGGSDTKINTDPIHVETPQPPHIWQVYPRQQEPSVPSGTIMNALNNALGYTCPNCIQTVRYGRVRIIGDDFGPERRPIDQVRIGDPRTIAPAPLQYDSDGDPYTVEECYGGVSLRIGIWGNEMVGVYLYPEPGEPLRALYGPDMGIDLHWLDQWLGMWVVKYNGGRPLASNVEPIKILIPLPD